MAMTIDEDSICITKIETEASQGSGKTYTLTYNFKYTGTFDVLTPLSGVGGMPIIGAQLAEDTTMYCSNIVCNQFEDSAAKMGELKATFKENFWVATDPTAGKDQARWTYNEEQRDIFIDKDNKVIVNSAGQVFSSSPVVNVGTWTVTVTGYRSSYNLPTYSNWHLVNSGAVTIDGITIPAKYARLVGVETERESVNGYNVIRHTWTLKINNKEWDLKIPNMGFYEKVSGEQKRIYRDGKPVDVPWPLAADGTALPKGFNPVTDITTKTFDITEEYDFSTFGWTF